MEKTAVVRQLWNDIHTQNWGRLEDYFCSDAVIEWNNTNEQFTVHEFIAANSLYPGNWSVAVERLEACGDLIVSVVKVTLRDADASFHAASFFKFRYGKIGLLNEYWGEDGPPPQWRTERGIGRPIHV